MKRVSNTTGTRYVVRSIEHYSREGKPLVAK
jgi:hypothetical protein